MADNFLQKSKSEILVILILKQRILDQEATEIKLVGAWAQTVKASITTVLQLSWRTNRK
jgi:hypothetical protein